MISIRIQQLTKRFGAVTALQQLDLTIEAGELFFLLGPSGQVTRVIETAGRYRSEQLERFHEHCREYGLPYELW